MGEAILVPGGYFPDDLDTTSLALTVLPPEQPEVVTAILDQLAEYVTSDGLFLVRSFSRTPSQLTDF